MIKISIPTIILQWINFLILVWVLKKVFYKPLLDFLDRRRNEVESNLRESERLKEEAKQLSQEIKKRLARSRHEALEIIEKSKDSGQQEREKILEEARNKANRIMENARKQIDVHVQKEREKMLQDLGDLSTHLAERIIRKELESEDIDKLTDDFLKELQET